MKSMIIIFSFLVALGFVMAGVQLDAQVRVKRNQVENLGHDIDGMKAEVLLWEGLRQEPGVGLNQAYMKVFNDFTVMAHGHHLSFLVNVPGADQMNVLAGARDSAWAGVKELRVQVVFSGIKSRGTLLSLLEQLDGLAQERALLFKKVYFEKDVLKVDLNVMGVGV
ncbi:MAG: hypothetical protein V2A70_07410 [Candidatus Omnitrophota bacterium]